MEIIKPTFEEIQSIDLSPLYMMAKDNDDNRRLLRGDAGVEHYKLLVWLSRQFNDSKITEIGTLGGLGTIALAENPTNFVKSFDIRLYSWGNETPENAVKNVVYDGYMNEVLESSLIFYDAAHEGKEEQEFFEQLILNNWKGVLVLDDIHLNDEMKAFWGNVIELCKNAKEIENHPLQDRIRCEDWTDLGHATGTGMVFFG